jgi:hypothetical protein
MTDLKAALKTISEPALKTAVDQLTKAFKAFSVKLATASPALAVLLAVLLADRRVLQTVS